jgi:hypothetical protein
MGNRKSQFVFNDILSVDSVSAPLPDKRVIIWSHDTPRGFEYHRSVADADRLYTPTFSHNTRLTVAPRFVDEADFDFHSDRVVR